MTPNSRSRNRKGGQASFGRSNPKAAYKSGSSNKAVPLLKFGVGDNWLIFNKFMITTCLKKFGDLGGLNLNQRVL